MKIVSRAFLGFALVAGVLFSIGCTTDTASRTAELPGENRFSSMPQNLPQSWEGQGMLGGMAGYQ